MPIGGSERAVGRKELPDQAFTKARAALASVGKVTEDDASEHFLRGTARYGLQKVRVKVNVEDADTGSTVRIRAQGDDVWGKAAKTVVQRLADAMEG